MKNFKSRKDESTIMLYERNGSFYYKHTQKFKWVKHSLPIGPFKDEGVALLAICRDEKINFSDFYQNYPKVKKAVESTP